MNTEIEKVQGALVSFDHIEAGLAELRTKYTGLVFDVATPDGMRDAKVARGVIRDPRTATEKIRKDAKAPILALGRQLDAKAKYIESELLKIENPITAQIEAEEGRKQREEFEEQQRIIRIREAIHNLELVPGLMAGKSSAEITKRVAELTEYSLEDWAAEHIVEAERARARTLQALQGLHAGAVAQEAQAAAKAAQEAADKAELAQWREKRSILEPEPAPEPGPISATSGVSHDAELNSARAILNVFRQRYRHLPEFAPLVAWIDKYMARVS